ncbi:MAG: hypothetical protein V4622_08080 [Bacteroidota bacterium]
MKKLSSSFWEFILWFQVLFVVGLFFLSIFLFFNLKTEAAIFVLGLGICLSIYLILIFYHYKVIYYDNHILYCYTFPKVKRIEIEMKNIIEIKKINFLLGGGFNSKVIFKIDNNYKIIYFTPILGNKLILENLLSEIKVS